jgi:hypothetical protein
MEEKEFKYITFLFQIWLALCTYFFGRFMYRWFVVDDDNNNNLNRKGHDRILV